MRLELQKRDSGVLLRDDKAVLKIAVVQFKELLYNTMASLRTYCKHDPIIVQKLIWMLRYLEKVDCYEEEYKEAIKKELKNLIEDSIASFDSDQDIEKIKNIYQLYKKIPV